MNYEFFNTYHYKLSFLIFWLKNKLTQLIFSKGPGGYKITYKALKN